MRRAATGSGSVWVLAMCAMVAVAGVGGTVVGSAVIARHRADAAADLAALAAAAAADPGAPGPPVAGVVGEPCAVARRVAQANGARLTGCVVDPVGTVTVTVAVRPAGPGARVGVAVAAARAGRLPPVPAHRRQPER